VLRHIVAGDVYSGQEPRSEVIAMAAERELVEQLLSAATKAKIEVVGMHVEPKAIVDCFLHIYRRRSDASAVNCFVDIGGSGTRAVIAQGGQILFVRAIPIGGEHFDRAVAEKHQISRHEAKLLRWSAHGLHHDTGVPPGRGVDSVGSAPRTDSPSNEITVRDADPARRDVMLHHNPEIESAIGEPVNRLVEDLILCRRYHEAAFPTHPVQRLIFVGGEAQRRELCVSIARMMGLSAQIGDPLIRMGRTTRVGIECGIDRRQPQPGWAVAIGLSMGSSAVHQVVDNH
jgi:cell division ATPase FtsA